MNQTKRKKSLILFSGGVDSSALLKKMLTETDDEMVVLHIQLKNHLNRWQPEYKAVQKLIPHFKKNYRDFLYKELSVEYYSYKDRMFDPYMVSFFASHVAADEQVDRILVGMILEDITFFSGAHRIPIERRLRAETNRAFGTEATWEYPFEHISKGEIYKYLTDEEYQMTFSCRNPKGEKTCGECEACTEIKMTIDKSVAIL